MALLAQREEHGISDSRGNAAFECEIVTDFARLQELAPAWERLWQADSRAEIFQRFAWVQCWWQCFGHGSQLFTPVVFRGGDPLLILPLVRRGDTLRFLGSPHADYSDFLCCDSCPEQPLSIALETLLQARFKWRECILEDLHPHSNTVALSRLLPGEFTQLMQLEVTGRCPTILLGKDRNEVIDSRLANKHVRRRLQKLHKSGRVSFRHLEDTTEAQQQLTDFFQCHRRRCAVLAKTSCFDDPEMRQMVRTLVDQLDLRRELRFGTLELDGRSIAWSLGFQVKGKYAYYQQTFDLAAEAYAPGDLLLHYLLLYARSNVEREFDFLRGEEFFKMRFASHINPTYTLYLERPGVRGRVQRYRRSAEGQLYRVVSRLEDVGRKHEKVFHLFRSARVRISTVSRHLRHARATGRLGSYLLSTSLKLLRKCVWDKTEYSIFQKRSTANSGAALTSNRSDPTGNIFPGQFGDLADILLEHPNTSFPGFDEYKDRLKRGERAYIVRQGNTLSLLAWVRLVPQESRATAIRSQPTSGPAIEVYECRPTGEVFDCRALISLLAREASKAGADLIIRCPDLSAACEVELDSQGFVSTQRIASYRVCHWLQYSRVYHKPMLHPQPDAAVYT